MTDPHDQAGLVAVRVDRLPGRTVAALTGELDMSNAGDVLRRLTEAAVDTLTLEVDLTGLAFIDSAGIAALDRLHRSLSGGPADRLLVVAGSDSVAGRTLRLAGMDRVLPMAPANRPTATRPTGTGPTGSGPTGAGPADAER